MTNPNQSPLLVVYLRWSARIWSVVVLLVMLTVTFARSPNSPQPVSVGDKLMLAFNWLVVLGLAIAWRREGPGGALAVTGVVAHNLTHFFTRGSWYFIQPSGLIVTLFMLMPGAIFLLSWALSIQETSEPVENSEALRST